MSARRGLICSLVVGVVLSAGVKPAHATLQNFKSVKEAYPERPAKATSCKTCHEHAMGTQGDLNAYGAALQESKGGEGSAKVLTVEDYRAIEGDDADADGATNGDELQAGTDPADPASVPEGETTSRAPETLDRLQAYLRSLVTPDVWADEAAEMDNAQEGAPPEPQAEYVGLETCAACHAKESQEFKHSTHARIAVPNGEGAQGCETCHGPGSLHVEAGGGKGVGGIINPRKDPSLCFSCHLDKKVEFRLPYHHPVMEGKMGCVDCHNAHGDDVRPWSATSLKDVNEACFKCHKDQRGPFVNEHEALREGCTTCHKVHGAIHEKMLVSRDSNLCLRCHTQTNFPTIGGSGHGSRLFHGSCFSAGCHTAVHGSNFDDHLRY